MVGHTHVDVQAPSPAQRREVLGSPLLEAVKVKVPVAVDNAGAFGRKPPLWGVLPARPCVGDEQRKLPRHVPQGQAQSTTDKVQLYAETTPHHAQESICDLFFYWSSDMVALSKTLPQACDCTPLISTAR